MDLRSVTHNTRSPEQWEIIKDLDFGDIVVDFGCGYADLLFRIAIERHLRQLIGVEENPSIIFRNMRINEENLLGIQFLNMDIMEFVDNWDHGPIDTAICFSVLPYLDVDRPDYFLAWLANNAEQTLIECQYAGDGPGFPSIKDDYDMGMWLSIFWNDFEPIGHTTVDYRKANRTIWVCRG